jgi:hypothetical protein
LFPDAQDMDKIYGERMRQSISIDLDIGFVGSSFIDPEKLNQNIINWWIINELVVILYWLKELK